VTVESFQPSGAPPRAIDRRYKAPGRGYILAHMLSNFPRLRFGNVVFDLDGTLVDSLPGIEASLRVAVARLHPRRTLAEGALRPLIGPLLPKIMAMLWPDLTPAEITALVAEYRADYLLENCARSAPFPGVSDLLQDLHAAGARLFLLTNKPQTMARLILNRQGWTPLFTEIACPDDPQHSFANKAAGAVSLRDRHGLAPAETLLLGDARDDAEAAAAAGFHFVRASYGYGKPAGHGNSSGEREAQIDTFADLRRLVFDPAPDLPTDDHPQPLR
jgi:phosphoglycolate phosphatase